MSANEQAIQNIQNIVEKEQIDCDFEKKDNFVYTLNKDEVPKIRQEVDTVKSLGFNCDFVPQSDLPFNIRASIRFRNQARISS